MSTLKKFKSLSNKQVKRIISLILIICLGSTSAITVAALSKDVTIKDGEEVTKIRTLHSETKAVLKQAKINVGENDKIVRTDSSSNQVDIDIKRAFYVDVVLDGVLTSCLANDETVEELLKKNNIDVNEDVYTSVGLNEKILPNMQIVVSHKIPVNVFVDGKNETVLVPKLSVLEVLRFLNINLSSEDIVNEPIDKIVEEGMNIIVNRVETKEITEKEIIPFSTDIKKSESLYDGDSKIEEPGINGEKEVTKRQKYINGNMVEAEVLAENVLKNPVNQVKIVGTKRRTKANNVKVSIENGLITDENGNQYKYNKVLTGVCTAYTEKPGARTSTGAIARRGLVAVNPKEIPYGTRLYIPGYGFCVAADTGGAMRQGRAMIDLYMNSESECRQFGRRTKQVYVLS